MRFFTLFIFVIYSNVALASDIEREALANYLLELNKIDRLYQKAKDNKGGDPQYQFKYEKFESDLKKIKEGIQDYLEAPKRAPKVLTEKSEPLSGEYR